MESEQVAIEDAFNPKKETPGIAEHSARVTGITASPRPAPNNTNARSFSSSSSGSGTSSGGAGSEMAQNDSLSVKDLSWPSQEER